MEQGSNSLFDFCSAPKCDYILFKKVNVKALTGKMCFKNSCKMVAAKHPHKQET